jgi:hypothetical protein
LLKQVGACAACELAEGLVLGIAAWSAFVEIVA